jgi:hypothetical protein
MGTSDLANDRYRLAIGETWPSLHVNGVLILHTISSLFQLKGLSCSLVGWDQISRGKHLYSCTTYGLTLEDIPVQYIDF